MRDPLVAAGLAWLIPGLGHWYQGRRAKAVIFFVCIVSSFYYGLYLGDGRVVYASWNPSEKRLFMVCHACVGLPSLPAFVQSRRFGYYNDDALGWELRVQYAARSRLGIEPIDGRMPANYSSTDAVQRLAHNEGGFWNWFMAPPVVKAPDNSDTPDELDALHKNLNRFFELGTIYTAIAGLLNVLAIYDAWGGPAFSYRSPRFAEQVAVGNS